MASALAASPSVKVSAEGPGKGVGSGSERETRRWRGIRRGIDRELYLIMSLQSSCDAVIINIIYSYQLHVCGCRSGNFVTI